MILASRFHVALVGSRTSVPRVSAPHFYSSLSLNHSIYLSNSTNPYFNLTLEDWLFKHKDPKEPLLLIYRDHPCVVLGRNQNPWKEVNLAAVSRTGIPFVRRRSGGGTVYHDMGNTNYSIHLPRKSFDKTVTAEVVARAVRSLGVDASVNERNDICIGKNKISGSAYKIANNRAYHHGTMLITTKLDTLGDLLRVSKDSMLTKGVASVRSPVCNISQVKAGVTHEDYTRAMIRQFSLAFKTNDHVQYIDETKEIQSIEYIRNGMNALQGWEWKYGQTPEFTYEISQDFAWGHIRALITSRHGIIKSCRLEAPTLDLFDVGQLESLVATQKYGFMELQGDRGSWDPHFIDVWDWLVTKTLH
jgi:lipoate-protein ligase A